MGNEYIMRASHLLQSRHGTHGSNCDSVWVEESTRFVAIIIPVFISPTLSWKQREIQKPPKTQMGRPIWKLRVCFANTRPAQCPISTCSCVQHCGHKTETRVACQRQRSAVAGWTSQGKELGMDCGPKWERKKANSH